MKYYNVVDAIPFFRSPAPHGAGGLKYHENRTSDRTAGSPAPHGAGGLKCAIGQTSGKFAYRVPPRTGRVG